MRQDKVIKYLVKQTLIIGSSKADITGSKSGFFADAGTIMLSCISIISSRMDTPSLTAGGGERSTETRGGYLISFSPRAFRISKYVLCAASLSAHTVSQRAVSLPSRSDIC